VKYRRQAESGHDPPGAGRPARQVPRRPPPREAEQYRRHPRLWEPFIHPCWSALWTRFSAPARLAPAAGQFLPGGGAGVPLHGVQSPAQVPGDLPQPASLSDQLVHPGVVLPGPAGQLPGQVRRCSAGRRGRRGLWPGGNPARQARCAATHRSALARFCHRWKRSATWTASAPRCVPSLISNGTVGYQNYPDACCRHARIGRSGRVMRRLSQAAGRRGCSGVKGAQVSRKRSWLRPHHEDR
jgi:hypothetical protein